ncbi:MAG: hypothetical protein ABFD92_00905 [Planctomycetaceae bacterium]|nr:hypothetical protein [Planctomycetaceae bacterium]
MSARIMIVLAAATVAAMLGGGCHTAYQCPILQPMTGGNIPAPLPPQPNDATDMGSGAPQRAYVGGVAVGPWPEGDAYKVTGYRDGIRFYIVQYADKIYRGGDITSEAGIAALKELGIKTIISITPSDRERELAAAGAMTLVEIPFGAMDMSADHLSQFMSAVDKSPKPIYVHDFDGTLRAGALMAHYRIHKDKWSYDRAMHEWHRLDVNVWDYGQLVSVIKENSGQ